MVFLDTHKYLKGVFQDFEIQFLIFMFIVLFVRVYILANVLRPWIQRIQMPNRF